MPSVPAEYLSQPRMLSRRSRVPVPPAWPIGYNGGDSRPLRKHRHGLPSRSRRLKQARSNLLLYLVKKNEVDILDIPIAKALHNFRSIWPSCTWPTWSRRRLSR